MLLLADWSVLGFEDLNFMRLFGFALLGFKVLFEGWFGLNRVCFYHILRHHHFLTLAFEKVRVHLSLENRLAFFGFGFLRDKLSILNKLSRPAFQSCLRYPHFRFFLLIIVWSFRHFALRANRSFRIITTLCNFDLLRCLVICARLWPS